MTNHPNRATGKFPRYYKVSPRGFDNEITYYLIADEAEAAECAAEYDLLADKRPGVITGWTNDRVARAPGVAVPWVHRVWLGPEA